MDKPRAYFAEYPDKDLTVIIIDDGEEQKVHTASTESTRVFMDTWREQGFEVFAFTSSMHEIESGNKYRHWHPVETEVVAS